MISDYVVLGRSGLRVSRFCFGHDDIWNGLGLGSAEDTSRQIFNQFLDSGCNFIDSADGYTNGTRETLIANS